MFILQKKKNANTKTRRSNKARFLYTTVKKTPSSGKSLIRTYSLKWVGWGEHLYEFDWEEEGWARIRGWALINFFCVQDGRLFEVGANLQLGAYSNKYGIQRNVLIQ